MGDQRGEPVVVPEPDLGGRDGVVLVDDRERTELQQLGEGLPRIAVVSAPHHVIDSEQDLPRHDPVPGELPLVVVGQQPLPDGSRRLLGRQTARATA